MDARELVPHGTESALKRALILGVVSLFTAPAGHFRPHLCLNKRDGVEALETIKKNPDSIDASFRLGQRVNVYSSEIWLNVCFFISLRGQSGTGCVRLTPRQTAFIIRNLPQELQQEVLEKVKVWYETEVVPKMKDSLQRIQTQMNDGKMLLPDAYGNRVFDTPVKPEDTPYTEWDIVGDVLFTNLCLRIISRSRHGDRDPYAEIDQLIRLGGSFQ